MKNILVTGASKGLGLAIVESLAADGFRVVAVARSTTPELDQVIQGSSVVFEPFDLAEVDSIHRWVSQLTAKHGRFFGLVNNAAIGADGVLATMHERDIARALLVNLQSPIILSKYVARSMLLQGEGRIVNISSIIATNGFSGLAVYGASKAGLLGFTKSLSRELGKAGITVNCVAPGYMDTAMTKGIAEDKLNSIKRRSPSGRLVGVKDAAGAVSFLMGPAGSMITGTSITVDAGSTA